MPLVAPVLLRALLASRPVSLVPLPAFRFSARLMALGARSSPHSLPGAIAASPQVCRLGLPQVWLRLHGLWLSQ